jgi:MFS family permease
MTLLVRDRRVIAIQAAIGWCLGGLGPALIIGARDLDVARYQLSWLGSAFGFALLGAGAVGRRALSRGAMPVVAAGTVMLTMGTGLLALGDRLVLLAAGGLLQGAGSSAFLIATPAIVGREDRAHRLAVAVGASSVAGLLAPGVIALTDHILWTGRIALMIPILWLIPFLAPANWKRQVADPPPETSSAPLASARLTMSRDTWLRWLVIVLGVSAEFCFWTWGAARLVDGGATDAAASGLVAAFAIGMALGRLIGPRHFHTLDPIRISAIVTSIAAAIIISGAGLGLLVAGLFLAGLGIAVLYPVALDLLLEDRTLPEPRLISLAAYASGVAITITPSLLGALDRVMPIQYAFGLVPILMATVVWFSRAAPPTPASTRFKPATPRRH